MSVKMFDTVTIRKIKRKIKARKASLKNIKQALIELKNELDVETQKIMMSTHRWRLVLLNKKRRTHHESKGNL